MALQYEIGHAKNVADLQKLTHKKRDPVPNKKYV